MPHRMTPRELADLMATGNSVYLLDVRRPEEHETARIAGSTLIPLDELPNRLDEVTPEAGQIVVVYCHHGIRSLSGAAILEQFRPGPAYSLTGGIEAWSVQIDPKIPRY